MTRQISQEGEEAIVRFEGEVLWAYDDFDPNHRQIKPGEPVRGTLTAGVGHTGPDVRPGPVTQQQSRVWLRQDLEGACRTVESNVKVGLSDGQFAALVSFVFNVGPTNFLKSTLLKKLNAGDYSAVPVELMKWTKSKGKTLQGLVNRRAQEAALWGKGKPVASAAVDVKKDAPNWMTKETVSTGVAVVTASSGLSGLVVGNGPFQYAAAAVFVLAAVIGGGFFLYERLVKK